MTATGLRERKKLATRQAIADAAMALFDARGFDAVTVAEIAEATGVSAKTVFNYFPVKEDLVLAGRRRHEDTLLAAIAGRRSGGSALQTVLECTLAVVRELEAMPRDRRARFRRVLAGSPSIVERLRERTRETERGLTALLREQANADPGDLRPALAASMLMSLWHLAFWVDGACLEDQPTERVAVARIRTAADLLGQGIGRYAVTNDGQ